MSDETRPAFGTPEFRAQAREARRTAVAEGLARFRQDFLDEPYWEDLAHARGLRLPQRHMAPTSGHMRHWLHALGVSVEDYKEWSGEKNLSAFAAQNSDWSLRAWVGLVLEWLSVRCSV